MSGFIRYLEYLFSNRFFNSYVVNPLTNVFLVSSSGSVDIRGKRISPSSSMGNNPEGIDLYFSMLMNTSGFK